MSTEPLKPPSEATLAKYGLTFEEWMEFIPVNMHGERICIICQKAPHTGRFVVDHKHVPGWKLKPPAERKRFVRGVICTTCNHYVLTRYGTPIKHRNAADYLEAFERRLSESAG